MAEDEYEGADPIGVRLHSTTDARVWAEEFCNLFQIGAHTGIGVRPLPRDDAFGLMIGWFANAIEGGRAEGDAAFRAYVVATGREDMRDLLDELAKEGD